ncbi:MAG: long-chain fatty acid--CoA ligase [Myxococcota bacterium]
MEYPKDLVHCIQRWAEEIPNRPALREYRNGQWCTVSWSDYWGNVCRLAKALIDLGLRPGDRVAIVGANRPEWVQFQFGVQAARGVIASIYPTSTLDQMAHIIRDSDAKFAVADGAPQLERYLRAEAAGLCPKLQLLATFDSLDHEDTRVSSFTALLSRGERLENQKLRARLESIEATDLCSLIYTSGTTGTAKGVQLDHGGQLFIAEGGAQAFPLFREPGQYKVISYLPLSHQAEQLFTNVFALYFGGEVTFCPDIAELPKLLPQVRPTVFLGVPRIWEKFEAALTKRFSEATGIRARLLHWARCTELSAFQSDVERGRRTMGPARWLARAVVIKRIRRAMGLDRIEVALTGAAPIAPSVQTFFASLGVCVYEAYGLSETSGGVSVTDPLQPRFGTVGKPFRGVSVRIAEDGEVLVRGRNVSEGYLQLDAENQALFTDDGWLRTGDLGTLQEDGNLRITGRKKELLITANGKNVAPTEIEQLLGAIAGVGHAVVVGDRKPYLSALIALDSEAIAMLNARLGLPSDLAYQDLVRQPELQRYLEREIETACNVHLARYQKIRKFYVLSEPLTVEKGDLTPTMKPRRHSIVQNHANEIEALYLQPSKMAYAS